MKYLAAATLLCLALVYHNRGEVLSLKSEVMYFKERIEALLTVIETICPDHVPEDYAHNRSKRALPLSVKLLLEKEHYARLYSVLTTCHAAQLTTTNVIPQATTKSTRMSTTTTPAATPTTTPTTIPTTTPTTTSTTTPTTTPPTTPTTTSTTTPTTTPITTPTTTPAATPAATSTTTPIFISTTTQLPSEICNRTNEHSDDYQNGTARLNCKRTPAAGQTWIAGALEVYLDNRWGYVCDDYNYLTNTGIVACRSLGGSLVEIRRVYQLPEDRFAMDDVECQGHEKILTDCDRYTTWQDNCGRGEGVFVNCTIPA